MPPDGAEREEYAAERGRRRRPTTRASGDAADIDWFADAASAPARRDDGEESDIRSWRPARLRLGEHLMGQLALTQLSARDQSLVDTLIEALDEDGYLSQSLEEIVEHAAAGTGGRDWMSCRSPCSICRTSTRPASARARPPSAWSCS